MSQPLQPQFSWDYQLLNNMTAKNSYTLPNIWYFSSNLAGIKFFSTIDLTKAYWQIPMHKDSIPNTYVTMPFGTYEFLKMPFGVKNAGSTFQ